MTGDAVFAGLDAAVPRVTDAYWMSDGIRVRLTDGRLLRIPFGYAAALQEMPPAAQREVVVTADGMGVAWPALGLTLPITAALDACAIAVDPGPGETLPLDVTHRSEDWA